VFEERLIFKPTRELTTDPATMGLAFREVWLQAADGPRLHAWLIPGPRRALWVWFHGYDGNIGDKLETVRLVSQGLGVPILIFDYRGYGRSEGRPSEGGLYLDGEAAVRWARDEPGLKGLPVVLFGRSLGAAIAVETARRQDCAGLVIESAFVSIQAMAAATLLGRIVGPVMRTRLNSLAKIGSVRAPVLVIHGDRDEKVPFDHGLRLFRAVGEPKELLAVRGAAHEDVPERAGPSYLATLDRFLRRVGVAPSESSVTPAPSRAPADAPKH